jgi:hypothetical protein
MIRAQFTKIKEVNESLTLPKTFPDVICTFHYQGGIIRTDVAFCYNAKSGALLFLHFIFGCSGTQYHCTHFKAIF